MTFKALIVEKNEDGKTNASVQSIGEDRLPRVKTARCILM